MRSRVLLLSCLCSAVWLAGFTGGSCGGSGTAPGNLEPREEPPPEPPVVVACERLSEMECSATQGCRANYVEWGCACAECVPGQMCPPCDCPDPATGRQFAGCYTVDPCEGLDERSCLSTAGCTPAYGHTRCAGGAQEEDRAIAPCEGGNCPPPPPCGGTEEQFLGCYSEPPVCAAVLCDIACEYGLAIDPNGCEICGCNPPPPSRCDGLDEMSCIASGICEPIYASCGGGFRAPCAEGESCTEPAPCDVDASYQGCAPKQPHGGCEAFGEQECLANPSCLAEYRGSGCADSSGDRIAPPCDPNADPNCAAPPVCEPAAEFVRCHDGEDRCPAIACPAIFCPFGQLYDSSGCPSCECAPAPSGCEVYDEMQCSADPRCEPVYAQSSCLRAPCPDGTTDCYANDPPCGVQTYAGCKDRDACESLDEMSCSLNPGCTPDYIEVCNGGAPCAPDSAGCEMPVPVCERVYSGCHQGWNPGGCRDDADCAGGYCEIFATCAALNCPPPPPAQCVYPSCNDGSQLACRALAPDCGPGRTAAIRNGCWECLDARTCS